MRSARLDQTDWRILRELPADGRITNVELAAKSASLRRPAFGVSARWRRQG